MLTLKKQGQDKIQTKLLKALSRFAGHENTQGSIFQVSPINQSLITLQMIFSLQT